MAMPDYELNDWAARLQSDPALAEAARLLAGAGTKDNPWGYLKHVKRAKSKDEFMQPTQFLKAAKGYEDELPHDTRIGYDTAGRPELERKGFMERNPWVGPALAAAPLAAMGIGALAGSGGGAAAGASAGSSLPAHLGGATAGAASGGAGNWLAQNWPMLAKLGLVGAGTVGAAANAQSQPEIPPELRQLLQMQMSRMQSQEPLYQAVLKLAQSRMPRG